MNTSKTWKSGERCRFGGTYRCQQCHLEGRTTVRDFVPGVVLPMCEACRNPDATWRLIRAASRAAAP